MPHATVDRLAQRPRLDGVLIEREAGAVHQTMPRQREHPRHALGGALLIDDQARSIGQLENAREVGDRARALGAGDHVKVVLVAVEIRQKDDAGFISIRRRSEDMAREFDRRREDRIVSRAIAVVERGKRRPRGRRDGIKKFRATRRYSRCRRPQSGRDN